MTTATLTEIEARADEARAAWDAAEDAYQAARRVAWATDSPADVAASREAFAAANAARTAWYAAEDARQSARWVAETGAPAPEIATAITSADGLDAAYHGSFYTISGVQGVEEYVTGYIDLLDQAEIAAPARWYVTTGAVVNAYASRHGEVRDPFPADLTVLMFPLDGLVVPRLAPFKVRNGDRWFDDVVQNMVAR